MAVSGINPEKILLVWDRIGDYHAARFRALEEAAGKGNLFIADLGGADTLYQWRNPLNNSEQYASLSSRPVEEPDLNFRMQEFKKLVKKHQVKVVGIAGYGRSEYRAMLHWCFIHGIRTVLFAESWYPGTLDFLKGAYLRFLCSGFLVSGERARQHFISRLGIPERRVFLPYSVVDNGHFSAAQPDYSSRIILCVARFSPEKNLERLVQAFLESRISRNGWTLKLVGGGPLAEKLRKSAGEGIEICDWVSYENLPALYAGAAFFILPSSFEPWGLVVNEAMAAGLAVAVSEECGCAPDLVPDSSFRFPADNIPALSELLKKIAAFSSEDLKILGMKNREHIRAFSPEAWAASFLKAAGR